ncbi:DUF1499 domain-containing protein [Desulfuromonas carbonis]|uniref:DUF1499 domain-containing protein n=1 Tax=Desulfuromonas sp. DDH964 TaxID=1823759 RepID=UPI00078CC84F|nr:DUF1499 domain-containing protein [Desulfuromonas sp. DDH964]AMV72792.1 hypothetical protein DBW_2462 [Desulfuromonas sp. DDH964]
MLAGLLLTACAGEIPPGLGLQNGRLAACPKSPNCFASQEGDADHRIAPLSYSGSRAAALERLAQVVAAQPRTRIVARSDDYLHAEARSLIFRFVDDLEFYLPADENRIEMRSAARSGWSDFGVNRRRLEQIRDAFSAD